jgi:uncharacterized protein (TIGR04255 family)
VRQRIQSAAQLANEPTADNTQRLNTFCLMNRIGPALIGRISLTTGVKNAVKLVMARRSSVHLTHAPLLLVLAQVRFSTVLKMHEFLPEIQEQLRNNGLPKFRAVRTQTELRVFGAEQSPHLTTNAHWEFASKDDRTMAVLGTDSISLSTTEYRTFEAFTENLAKLLETVGRTANISLRQRIGLRYIDVIVPSAGKVLSDYIADGLLGISLEKLGLKAPSSVNAMIGNSSLGTFVLRSTRLPKGSVVPADLLPLKLETDKPLTLEREFCVLDFDHFNEGTKDFDVPQTMKEFEELHNLIDRTFREEAVKPSAIEEWK